MMYSERWISDGSYIIGDEEYGYDLCRVNFYKNLQEELSPEQQDILARDIAGVVISAINQGV